ncbi:Polyketide cyclase/dehydrase and lipid transport superfamily protein [Forsythia ovata]|uniref:Polyketide cyclase/dehydrase and lipid transport superfamily protein n=1 Tax=Forsythia ovata TaxID=205694 RepID=A0ABD1WIF2_9LAMI
MAEQKKWEGTVSTTLENANADQIWPFWKDFYSINKWFPGQTTCEGIHGNNGEPGCIRYCGDLPVPAIDGTASSWTRERLIAIDDIEKSFSYEILECNFGVKSYVANVKIDPVAAGDNGRGCRIEWRFTVEPVEGWRLEDMVSNYEVWLKIMVKNMEAAVFDQSS